MKKLLSIVGVAVLAAATLFIPQTAFADSPGQLSNAATNYEVKNVTTGGAYAQSAGVTCDQTVKYSVLLANSDFGLLSDLTVSANLASGAISASATNEVSATTSVSGKVNVTVTKGTLAYVKGSTVRIATDGTTTNIADGITTGGVNVGDLTGSTQTFVQFEAKVTCPTTPVTPEAPETPETPTELPQTGVSESIIALTGLGALVASAAYYIASRRALNQ